MNQVLALESSWGGPPVVVMTVGPVVALTFLWWVMISQYGEDKAERGGWLLAGLFAFAMIITWGVWELFG